MVADLTPVAIALGSNLGDRHHHLSSAIQELSASIRDARVSAFRETAPVGVVGAQPPYLNAALAGVTALSARDLFRVLQDIEEAHGRERPHANAPRTLDLDLVLYGREIIDTSSLVVPHPRFRERGFVLEPLAEVAPDWVDPVSGHTIGELWETLKAQA